MPGGDSGLHEAEPALSSATAAGGGEERKLSVLQNSRETSEHLGGEESRASGGEVGQEDEEMASGSHDLSSSANHSPGSITGSTSTSAKRYLIACTLTTHTHTHTKYLSDLSCCKTAFQSSSYYHNENHYAFIVAALCCMWICPVEYVKVKACVLW